MKSREFFFEKKIVLVDFCFLKPGKNCVETTSEFRLFFFFYMKSFLFMGWKTWIE